MAKVRTRIAPSPTGSVHVGNAYGALLNYAFTRKNNGLFVLRIDDTDRKRHVEGSEEIIYSELAWLGLSWDESPDKGGKYGPYRPSEKLDVYKKLAQELIEAGKAYEDEGAVRLKDPQKNITWKDLIRDEVTFPKGEVTDYVIIKSDGFPTYNFATVVDDHQMEITHIIRGEEHISNTPRQIATYEAFGWEAPQFAHFPTLRNSEHKKLSKRRDNVSLQSFREEGYLPQALVNFLCLLGWSHPEGKEVFDLEEFVDKFEIGRVRKAGPIFDTKKLDWLNSQYINMTPDDKLAATTNSYTSFEVTMPMAALTKTRITKLKDAEELLIFFEKDPEVGRDIFEDPNAIRHVSSALKVLGSIDSWKLENINNALSEEIKEKEFKTGEFYMSMRLAIAGRKITPPINESMEILGQDEVLQRLERAQQVLLETPIREQDLDTDN